MNRTEVIAGPAIVTYNSVTFYSVGDIVAKPILTTFEVESSMFGPVDLRDDTMIWEISFTPTSQYYAGTGSARGATLFPYLASAIGSSMFGATDKNVVIKTLAGQSITFKTGCVVAMPPVTLSASTPPLGEVKLHCIGDQALDWNADRFAAVASSAFADTSFTPAGILTIPYLLTYGENPAYASLEASDGWRIEWDLQYNVFKVDSVGILDYRLKSVSAMIRGTPITETEVEIIALLQKSNDTSFVRGGSRSSAGGALELHPSGCDANVAVWSFSHANVVEAGFRFGTGEALRNDEIGFVTTRSFLTGVLAPVATLAALGA